jgi:hypothetical protein
LQLSRRPIQKTVVVAIGKSFRDLREVLLVARVKNLFISEPTLAIKVPLGFLLRNFALLLPKIS